MATARQPHGGHSTVAKMATVTGENLGENGQFLRKLWPF